MFAHQEQRGFNGPTTKAGLAAGTTGGTFKTANASVFGVDGTAYAYAATDNVAFTAAAQQAVLTKCLYLIQINAAGTVSTKKGTEVLATDLTAGRASLHFPRPDAGNAPLGAIKVALASTATFTAGTTSLAAANVTATYYDFLGGMPTAPLTS